MQKDNYPENLNSASEKILDDFELRNFLKISRRTSLNYRNKGLYPYYRRGHKIMYIESEVISGIKKNRVNHDQ